MSQSDQEQQYYRGYPVEGFDTPPPNTWQARQVELGGRQFPRSLAPGQRLQSEQAVSAITDTAMNAMVGLEQPAEAASEAVQ